MDGVPWGVGGCLLEHGLFFFLLFLLPVHHCHDNVPLLLGQVAQVGQFLHRGRHRGWARTSGPHGRGHFSWPARPLGSLALALTFRIHAPQLRPCFPRSQRSPPGGGSGGGSGSGAHYFTFPLYSARPRRRPRPAWPCAPRPAARCPPPHRAPPPLTVIAPRVRLLSALTPGAIRHDPLACV